MFPWNYGFHWNAGHIVFLGAFYGVLLTVAATVTCAALRSRRALRADRADQVRWQSDFHDLPARDRACRHVFTGEFRNRECPHGFDCRECETHPKLIALRPTGEPAEPGDEIFGMCFPADRFYHRGHSWARPEPDGTVTVGLDELGKRLLANPDHVELPPPGTPIHVNGTAFRVQTRGADVRILAPVDGEVIETGGPEGGWYLKVRPSGEGTLQFQHLLRGSELKPWLMREMERLQLSLSAGGARPALADGGVPVDDIAANCPEADWDAVCGEMFLQP